MSRGWRREPYRHSLSARGIKTSRRNKFVGSGVPKSMGEYRDDEFIYHWTDIRGLRGFVDEGGIKEGVVLYAGLDPFMPVLEFQNHFELSLEKPYILLRIPMKDIRLSNAIMSNPSREGYVYVDGEVSLDMDVLRYAEIVNLRDVGYEHFDVNPERLKAEHYLGKNVLWWHDRIEPSGDFDWKEVNFDD